jgi:hypothetical protein
MTEPELQATADFFARDISVTLNGYEWSTILGRILGKELSPEGIRVYNQAADKLATQLRDAARKSR